MDDLEQLLIETELCIGQMEDITKEYLHQISLFNAVLDDDREKLCQLVIETKDIEKAQELANSLYWNTDLKLAGKIRDAWKYKTGKSFKPTPIEVQIPCTDCGNLFPSLGKTAADAKNVKYKYCPDCESIRAEKDRLSNIERERWTKNYQLRLKELKTMPYQEYLQSPEWKKTRNAAYHRAGGRCQLCNCEGLLNVHHRDYSRRGEERNTDVIVLCKPCHEKFHDKEPSQ